MIFSSIVSSLVYFFVPIDAYLNGANLPMVVLITVLGALPALFAYKLGRFADTTNKYKLIALGLAGVAAIGVGLAVIPFYWFKLVSMFFMGIILEIFFVAQSSLVTTLGPEETYGERGSAFEAIIIVGDLVAPLILGISLDLFGFGTVALMVAIVAIILGFIYRSVKLIK
jgi:MFS family permease